MNRQNHRLAALCCAIGLVSTCMTAAADRPSRAETLTTYENCSVSAALPAAGEGSTHRLRTPPAHGVVQLTDTGFTYTPYQNHRGSDHFTCLSLDESGAPIRETTVQLQILPRESAMSYADMAGHPAEYAALRLSEEGIYTGASYGGTAYFLPDEALSRAEFLTLTLSAAGIQPVAAAALQAEIPAVPVWANGYTEAALLDGIITDGAQSAAPITRAEAAVILANTLDIAGAGESAPSDVPVWAADAWAALTAAGYPMAGRAAEALTRGDAALLLAGLLPDAEPVLPTGLFSWITAA